MQKFKIPIFHKANDSNFSFLQHNKTLLYFQTLKIQYEILIVQFLDKQTQFLRSNHNLILKNYLKQFKFSQILKIETVNMYN